MNMLTQAKREFIEFMMGADVLRFGEFKTKSGRMSPYFVNTGNYRTGSQIAALGKFYAACIRENCGAGILQLCLDRPIKEFRWLLRRQQPCPVSSALINHTFSTGKKQRIMAKGATWWVISPKMAIR